MPRGVFLFLLSTLPILIGCSDNKLAKVSGTVSVGGQPVPSGTIMFTPSGGPAAVGEIKNGSYTLTTSKPGDGAWIGSHRVVIQATSIGPSSIVEPKSIEDELATPGAPGKRLVPGKVTWLVPEKYSQLHTTPLTAEVKRGKNDLPFDLPADGK
ncbi:hypothetical protein [Anatilimnocola floriformis]|uniref:hypothetical protein n=1 Tax=Anatilimnocola floriformis TaxID=2948575 RepID=UPI0020C328B8|nr:hypothetical protein [Anatilimnocola floriformis]